MVDNNYNRASINKLNDNFYNCDINNSIMNGWIIMTKTENSTVGIINMLSTDGIRISMDNDVIAGIDFGSTEKGMKSLSVVNETKSGHHGLSRMYSVEASVGGDETSIEDDIIDALSPSPQRGGTARRHGGRTSATTSEREKENENENDGSSDITATGTMGTTGGQIILLTPNNGNDGDGITDGSDESDLPNPQAGGKWD